MTPSRVITSVRRTARAAAGILVDNFCPFWGLGCPKRGLKNGDTIVSLDADSRVILAIQATTRACHDSQPYLNQLNTIKYRYQLTIKQATADRAYGSAEIIEALLEFFRN